MPFSSFKSHKSDKLKPGNSQEEYICDFVESSILQIWLHRSYHYCPHYFITPSISFRSLQCISIIGNVAGVRSIKSQNRDIFMICILISNRIHDNPTPLNLPYLALSKFLILINFYQQNVWELWKLFLQTTYGWTCPFLIQSKWDKALKQIWF